VHWKLGTISHSTLDLTEGKMYEENQQQQQQQQPIHGRI